MPHAYLTLALKRKKKKNAQIIVTWGTKYESAKIWKMRKVEEEEKCTDHSDLRYEVWKCKNLENEKGRSYTSSHRDIRNSNKALWEMDREIRIGLDDWSITEALLNWNSEIKTEIVGYEIKKWKKATIPKTNGWHFCREITSDLWVKKKKNHNHNNNNNNNNK